MDIQPTRRSSSLVAIPAYNEVATIRTVVDRVDAVRIKHEPLQPIEVASLLDQRAITVEEHSRTQTHHITRSPGRRHHEIPR